MFAKRTHWDLSQNPLSLALDNMRAQGISVLDLTESNPTRAGIHYPQEIFLEAFLNPQNLIYTPYPEGMLRTREAVASYYVRQGINISAQRILLTASTSESYSFLFRLLLDPGDRVLIPAPSYPLFSYLADINDIEVAHYRLVFTDGSWQIDWPSLLAAARHGRARAVVLVSPNNPTGSCLKPQELVSLNAICAQYGLAIISDEVFSDYLYEPYRGNFCSLALNREVLSFAMGGLSKALALPQMKLGWMVLNGPDALVKEAWDRLEVIADTFLSVNTPVQNAAIKWLPHAGIIQQQILARARANLHHLDVWAAGSGFKVFPVEGGWYAVLQGDLGCPADEWILRLLQEKQVHVHPGYYFDFEDDNTLVVSLLTPIQTFQEGISRIV